MACAAMQYVEDSNPSYSPTAWDDAELCFDFEEVLPIERPTRVAHEHESWYPTRVDDLGPAIEFYLTFEKSPSAYEQFVQFVRQWKDETWRFSSLRKRVSHIAYLKIIGLGMVAVRWILEDLKREPDYWFPALEAITQIDPAPHAETMKELRDAWLEWGRGHGYIE
jgi:hypothetical protein